MSKKFYNKVKRHDQVELNNIAIRVVADFHKTFGAIGYPGSPGYRYLTDVQIKAFAQETVDRMLPSES